MCLLWLIFVLPFFWPVIALIWGINAIITSIQKKKHEARKAAGDTDEFLPDYSLAYGLIGAFAFVLFFAWIVYNSQW